MTVLTQFRCKRCKRPHSVSVQAMSIVCICGHFMIVADQDDGIAHEFEPKQKKMDFGDDLPGRVDLDAHKLAAAELTNVTVLTPERRCGVTQPDGTVHCQTCGLQWEVSDPNPPTCPHA